MSTLRRNQSERMHFLLFKHQQYEIASHFQQIENIFPLFFAIFRIILFRISEVYLNINFKLKRKLHRLTYGEIIINGSRYGCIITTFQMWISATVMRKAIFFMRHLSDASIEWRSTSLLFSVFLYFAFRH